MAALTDFSRESRIDPRRSYQYHDSILRDPNPRHQFGPTPRIKPPGTYNYGNNQQGALTKLGFGIGGGFGTLGSNLPSAPSVVTPTAPRNPVSEALQNNPFLPPMEKAPYLDGGDPTSRAFQVGGAAMMKSASRPGQTFLGALSDGLLYSQKDRDARKDAFDKKAMAKDLLSYKKKVAGLTGLSEVEKLMRSRDRYPKGSEKYIQIDNIINKKGSVSSTTTELSKLMKERSEYEASPKTPQTRRNITEINARIKKLTTPGKDPLLEYMKLEKTGETSQEKERGKGIGADLAEMYKRGSVANRSLPQLSTLRNTMSEVDYTGTGSTFIDTTKRLFETVSKQVGFKLPKTFKSDPNFQFSQSLQNDFVSALLKSRMGARPSDADLRFFAQVLPNMGMTRESNEKIMNHFQEILLNDIYENTQDLQGRVTDGNASKQEKRTLDTQLATYGRELKSITDRMRKEADPERTAEQNKYNYKPSIRMKTMLRRAREKGLLDD
jgi:hypothetical protein